jgi:hypothetical protein
MNSNISSEEILPLPIYTYYFSFRINKKKVKGKVKADDHRHAWHMVLDAVDQLEAALGGIEVTDITIPSKPQETAKDLDLKGLAMRSLAHTFPRK